MKISSAIGGVLAFTAILSANTALADFVVTDTVINTGTQGSPSYLSILQNPVNPNIVPTTSFNIGHSFNGSNPIQTGAAFGAADADPSNKFPSDSWNFEDDYFFGTSGATVQSVLISAALSGVSFLQARIIYQSGNVASYGGNNAGTLGIPVSGTVVDSWQDASLAGTFYNISLPTPIQNGNYILEVRGLASPSSTASSYGGTIAFNALPVPLPAALPLMLSGLGLLGRFGRRRSLAA